MTSHEIKPGVSIFNRRPAGFPPAKGVASSPLKTPAPPVPAHPETTRLPARPALPQEDFYLVRMRDQTMLVDAHLMNGEVLRGVMISAISRYALTIESNDDTVYVSKHAVAWIGPASPSDSQGTTEVAHE